MKHYVKKICLFIILSSFLTSGTIVKSTWVPIFVDDILTFIPYTLNLPDKDNDGIEDSIDTPTAYTQDIRLDVNSLNYSITLTGSDNDNPITYEVLTRPIHGTLSGTAPNLLYTPNDGYEGEDSFTFRVSDGDHKSEVVTIHINILSPISYGEDGGHPTTHHDEVDGNMTTVYYPTDIPDGTKVPVVFFAAGYGSDDAKD